MRLRWRSKEIKCEHTAERNVGKSTLMNALVGERISIATFKAQTTRHRIMGIYNTDDMQIVFSDTPGVLKPQYKLQESMLNFSTSALTDADVLLYVTDVVETPDKHNEFIEKVACMEIPVLLLINKIDLSNQEKLVELVKTLKALLSIIRSKLDLLMQEELDERSMNLVSDLYDLNTRMEHLNRNLLLLAKIENSQYTEMEEVDLGSFIRESMPTYNVLHSDLNISFLDQRTCHVVHNVNTILLSCLLN